MTTRLWIATVMSLPQLVFYQAIFLNQILGVRGLFDSLVVPLDATVAGKLFTAFCMLGLPLLAALLAAWSFKAEPRLRRWSGALLLANLGLMAVLCSHLIVEGMHEANLR